MKRIIYFTVLYVIILNVWNVVSATTPSALFLRIPQGARGIALGNAFVAVADDPTAMLWNTAGMAEINRMSANFSYNSYIFGIQSFFISFVYPLLKDKISVGGAVMYSELGTMEGRTETGTQSEFVSLYDYTTIVSFAMKINRMLFLGTNFKYIRTKLWSGSNDKAGSVSVDFGTKVKILEPISAGMMIKNLGTKLKYGTVENVLPLDIEFGVSAKPIKKLLLSSDLSFPSNSSIKLRLGTEFAVNPTFVLRCGFNTESKATLSVGVGIKMPISIGIGETGLGTGVGAGMTGFLTPPTSSTEEKNLLFLDYAYTNYIITNLGGTHRISVSFKF